MDIPRGELIEAELPAFIGKREKQRRRDEGARPEIIERVREA